MNAGLADFPSADYDYLLKVIMVGDSGVGKSALLKCFMGEEFTKHYVSTIGVDFEIKQLEIDGQRIHLQIWIKENENKEWDTAGQERFRTITTSYYRSSDAILLVFDVTDPNSFKNVEAWLEDVRAYAKKEVDVMLLGNKVDLEAERIIDYDTANTFATEHGLPLLETSAKTGHNVDSAFHQIALAALKAKITAKNRLDEVAGETHAGNVRLSQADDEDEEAQSQSSGCC